MTRLERDQPKALAASRKSEATAKLANEQATSKPKCAHWTDKPDGFYPCHNIGLLKIGAKWYCRKHAKEHLGATP